MRNIPFNVIDWTTVEKVVYPGEAGEAVWQTLQFAGIRIRLVEYSAGYVADHWCQKGHVVHCLEGAFSSALEGGEPVILRQGMSYVVSDDMSSHRSHTEGGARLLIVDGDFLR